MLVVRLSAVAIGSIALLPCLTRGVSFCGKSKEAVEKVIAGPEGVYICNECVMLCVDILNEELQDSSGSAP